MIDVIDFGLKDYASVLDQQQSLFNYLIKEKIEGNEGKEYLLIGEHFPVITLGRRANENNILLSQTLLQNKGIPVFHIGRGGDVTYHCPGQLIVYPIIDLEKYGLGVKDYVFILEESVIKLLDKYHIKSGRVEGATGVWIDGFSSKARKICAIGVKCSRFCTMHGLALNVNADLSGFSMINPCGFQDKGVTSLKLEKNRILGDETLDNFNQTQISMEKVKKEFLDIFFSLIFPL